MNTKMENNLYLFDQSGYYKNLLIVVISPYNISWLCDLCCFVVIYLDGQFMHFMMPIMYAIPNLVNKRGIAIRQTSSFKW